MSTRLGWLVAAVALGALGATWLRPSPAVREAPKLVCPAAVDPASLRAMEGRIVERIVDRAEPPAPVTPAPPAPEPAPAPTPEAAASAAAGVALVERATRTGHWTSSDAEELGARLRGLPREEVEAILGELIPAVNEGRVRVEVQGPLF